MTELQKQFGEIDIYLFDQLLRGRILPGMLILDAGCGLGRNLVYLLRQGYEVFGVDQDAQSVEDLRGMAKKLAPALSPDHFRVEAIEAMSFADGLADVVISNAVLHFARRPAVSRHAGGHLASGESGRAAVLPPGFFDRRGAADPVYCGAPV